MRAAEEGGMDLIAIGTSQIDGTETRTVNARDLHAFLEVGKDFSTWIRDRIEQYGFVEGRDFITYQDLRSPNSGSTKARPQVAIEYALTLDMAKELAMVERNEKGKAARAYFIECERRAKAQVVNPATLSRIDLIRIAMEAEQERMALSVQVEAMRPDVEAFALLAKSEGALCVSDAAKALNVRPQRLFQYLKEKGWIYKRPGGRHWLGYQQKVQLGLLAHITATVTLADGTDRLTEQVVITPKGLTRLSKEFAAPPLPVPTEANPPSVAGDKTGGAMI
jgi:anti-repressor protein